MPCHTEFLFPNFDELAGPLQWVRHHEEEIGLAVWCLAGKNLPMIEAGTLVHSDCSLIESGNRDPEPCGRKVIHGEIEPGLHEGEMDLHHGQTRGLPKRSPAPAAEYSHRC